MIFHGSSTEKGSKGQTRELSKSKVVVLKNVLTEVFGSQNTLITSARTGPSKARKNGTHLEDMLQGFGKNLKKGFSRTKTIRDEQTKSLGVFPSTINMIKEEWYFDNGCS